MSLDDDDHRLLLEAFLADADERLGRIEAGLDDPAPPSPDLVRDAHTLVGSASAVGLESFAETSRQLHAALDSGDVERASACARTLRAELRTVPAPRRVLAIEDDPTNRLLLERLAERSADVELTIAHDGESGLELARDQTPDLILLDLLLPDIHGEDVLRQLLEDETTRGVPVVVLSSDAAPERAAALIEAGAADYLTKPVDLERLLELMGGAGVDEP